MLRPILLALVAGAAAAQPALRINEVAYDPPAPQPSSNEWVEVVNAGDAAADLAGLVLADASNASDSVPAGTVVEPGGFAVLVRDGAAFAAAYPGVAFVEVPRFPALNNGGDRPALVRGGVEVDAVPYEPSWGGRDASLERRDPLGPSDEASNFGTTESAAGGTPGAPNTLLAQDTDPPTLVAAEALDATAVRLAFSEPLDPATVPTATYAVEPGGAVASAGVGASPSEILLTLAAPLSGRRTFTVTVSGVTDARGNRLDGGTASFFFGAGDPAAPRDLVINEFLYDEPSADNPGEFVELFNRTDKAFDLRQFTLNDGTGDDRPITGQPVFVEPGGYAVVVEDASLFQAVFPGVAFVEQPSWSALNNTGDAVVLKFEGAVVDSLFYRPSWGGEDASLERRDPDGPSSTSANWATTADLRGGTPGAENSRFEPDVTGPALTGARASPDGRAVTVDLSEPVEPQSTAGAFSVEGAQVTGVAYEPGALTVRLALAGPLPAGSSTVTAIGLEDLLGNGTASTSTTVEFTPDEAPPRIVRARALDAQTVRVEFSEPVTAASALAPDAYRVGDVAAVAVTAADEAEGGVLAADVALASALPDRQLATITAAGITDLAGNAATAEARFFVGQPDVPGPGEVVVTEILFDPQNGSAGEYLEVLNTTADRVFSLRAIRLDDGDGDGDPLADGPTILLPGEHAALVRDPEGFRVAFPEAPFVDAGGAISLSNSGEPVVLRADDVVLDSVFYDPGWHRVELDDATGISLERRDPAGPSNAASNWSSSLSGRGGTPSAANSVSAGGDPVEREPSLAVSPSPFAPTQGEAAEIAVTLSTDAALVRARVFDGGGRAVRELEPGRLVGGAATLVWDGTGDDRRPLRAGIYVVLVEAVDVEGGTTEAARGVVVLARPE